MIDYLNEAFKRLDSINEDLFDTDLDGIEKLAATVNSQEEEPVRVIDADAETYEDINSAYVGKIIITCNVCHSHIFKTKEDVTITEDGEVNIEEQCPYCGEQGGFVVVGEITKYPSEDTGTDVEDTTPVEEEPIVDEPKVQESFTQNNRKFISRKVVVENKISGKKHNVEVPDIIISSDDVEFDEATGNIKLSKDLFDNFVPNTYLNIKFTDNNEDKVSQYKMISEADEYIVCEYIGDANALIESSLTESVNNVNVETDNSIVNVSTEGGKVTVTTENKEEKTEEVISPLSAETQEEIISAQEVTEEPEVMNEIDVDIEEVDESSLDELGESYLKNVYENVESFKTSSVSTKDNRFIVEGCIKFKSGVSKKTGFIFEAKCATKSGKVKFIGENKHLCKGSKAFTLSGKMEGTRLIAESFTYNYRAKNAEGKPTKVYGTVRTSNK